MADRELQRESLVSDFSKFILGLMRNKEISQKQLVEKLGWTRDDAYKYLGRFIKGECDAEQFTLQHLSDILTALGCELKPTESTFLRPLHKLK